LRKIVFCDVDGVLVDGQTQKKLLTYLFREKKVSFGLAFVIYGWFLLYQLHLVRDVIKIRQIAFSAFRGWSKDELKNMFRDFFQAEVAGCIRQDVVKILKEKVAAGCSVVLVTATLAGIAEEIVSCLGFGDAIATELEFVDGKCTGKIFGDVPYGINKLKAAEAFMAARGMGWDSSLALGDHISDAFLLERAQDVIVVQPDDKLKQLAIEKGWLIHAVD
jgi:HAD superfamily phosphoserine phosphatase-like hydrolase